jgi:CheY-like chemotaxis protein
MHMRQALGGRLAIDAGAHAPLPAPLGADLVLMDIETPHFNGFDATEAIRTREVVTGRHLLIVAISAHPKAGDRERCRAAGMDGCVTRPISGIELTDVLNRLAVANP